MCETCPAHIPGPGEVAGGLAGLAADGVIAAGKSRIGRRVMFWVLAVPMFAGILVYVLGWWLVPIMLGLAALAAAVHRVVRFLHRLTVQARPEPTHAMRDQLAARGLRAIPAPVRVARPALPRNLAITRPRRALPAPAKPLPAAVVAGTVVPAGEKVVR